MQVCCKHELCKSVQKGVLDCPPIRVRTAGFSVNEVFSRAADKTKKKEERMDHSEVNCKLGVVVLARDKAV